MEKQRTWKPIAAGILDMILGCYCLLWLLFLVILMSVGFRFDVHGNPLDYHPLIVLLISGILAITGGIYSMKRNRWGLALVGSVAIFLPILTTLIGMYDEAQTERLDYLRIVTNRITQTQIESILLLSLVTAAIVLTVLSKKEFE